MEPWLAVRLRRQLPWPIAAAVLLGLACFFLWPNLDHPAFVDSDEAGHQAATRGFFDTGLPRVYSDPLRPTEYGVWCHAGIFLHKPPLPFALGALIMRLIGVRPLALRLVSFLSMYLAALCTYLIGRRVMRPLIALGAAAALLLLPFCYDLVQGYQFGDVTDCSLLGCVALSFWALARALERRSTRLAALAGALCGCGVLCKSPLALCPLGALVAMAFLGSRGWAERVRPRMIAAFALALATIALPWNIYSAIRWPDVFWWEAKHTLGFISSAAELYTTKRFFTRPFDALFSLVNRDELRPWPAVVALLAGVWLARRALRERRLYLWVLCLWLWGEWIPLALTAVKVPAHAWGAAPAVLLAIALAIADAWERPALAGAIFFGFGTATAMRFSAWAADLPDTPAYELGGQHGRWELGGGFALAALGALFGLLIARWGGAHGWKARLLGLAMIGAVLNGLYSGGEAERTAAASDADRAVDVDYDQLGRVLDRVLPLRSVLFIDTPRDSTDHTDVATLTFYSGRMAYREEDKLVDEARRRGYHVYRVSRTAQPYKRVDAVPAAAWAQAFDLDQPLPVPEPPPGDLIPAPETGRPLLGYAVSDGGVDRSRYVVYLSSKAGAPTAPLVFHGKQGMERRQLGPARVFEPPEQVAGARWFTMTTPGPPIDSLSSLNLGVEALPLPGAP